MYRKFHKQGQEIRMELVDQVLCSGALTFKRLPLMKMIKTWMGLAKQPKKVDRVNQKKERASRLKRKEGAESLISGF